MKWKKRQKINWYINCALNIKHLVVGSYDYWWSGKNDYAVRQVWRYQKGAIRSCTIQWPKEKGQTTIYKTLHRTLKIEQHEPHLKLGVNPDAPEGLSVSAPHLIPVVLLLNDTNIRR